MLANIGVVSKPTTASFKQARWTIFGLKALMVTQNPWDNSALDCYWYEEAVWNAGGGAVSSCGE